MQEYIKNIHQLLIRKRFMPRKKINSINNISIKELKKQKIKYIIFDIDQTLTYYHTSKIPKNIQKKLKELQKEFKCCGLSNFNENNNSVNQRNIEIKRKFNLTIIHSKYKKPNRKAYEAALHYLKASPKNTLAIGNCNLSDIIGANILNIQSIQVKSILKGSPIIIKIYNSFEDCLYWLYKRTKINNNK